MNDQAVNKLQQCMLGSQSGNENKKNSQLMFQYAFKDVRANCFCASLLRTQMHTPRHTRARALSNKMRNDRAKGHCYSFAWI